MCLLLRGIRLPTYHIYILLTHLPSRISKRNLFCAGIFLWLKNKKNVPNCHNRKQSLKTHFFFYRFTLRIQFLRCFRFFAKVHACMLVALRKYLTYLSIEHAYLSTFIHTYQICISLPTYLPYLFSDVLPE